MKSKRQLMTRGQVVAAPPETMLSPEEVAAWLNLKRREVTRLGLPCFILGHKTRIYHKATVLEWLQQQQRKAS